MRLLNQLKSHEKLNIGKDIISGVIVALVSIPISMGYAQIAGLPMIYGLYGSLLPILVFGFLTTSRQFVVGVDAMPAAMVGTMLVEFGIAAESAEAMQIIPAMSLLTAVWFVIFYALKAGRVVKYISTPVMGGFISGVGLTIILMQIPKLFGGSAGTGELFELLKNIAGQLENFNGLAALLGFGTIVIILICKRFIPKVPMTVIMMGVGALLEALFHLERYGIKMLPELSSGLPHFMLPDFTVLGVHFTDALLESFSIALVVMAQTLLASGNYASKYDDAIDNNAELLAYAGMNASSALTGCCPVNGSVSRSGIADSFGCRSQIMSISAAGTMLLVLLFGTPLLKYLPVPVLTGIVMTALIGIIDTKLSVRLFKISKNEFFIFMAALLGVLLFGTVNGVLIGCVLSLVDFALQCTRPHSSFVGRIPGQGNFYSIDRYRKAQAIKETVIYRFNGNLFFANIDRFQSEIEQAIKPDTKRLIVDARSIDSIDVTAADRLLVIRRKLNSRGIKFYITEHDGKLNDQLFLLGAGSLITEGAVRRTITLALEDCGIYKPYTLEGERNSEDQTVQEQAAQDQTMQERAAQDQTVKNQILQGTESDADITEFEWAFGEHADEYIEKLAGQMAEGLINDSEQALSDVTPGEGAIQTVWGDLDPEEEEELLDMLELMLEKRAEEAGMKPQRLEALEKRIERRRGRVEKQLLEMPSEQKKRLEKRLEKFDRSLQKHHPEDYQRIQEFRQRH